MGLRDPARPPHAQSDGQGGQPQMAEGLQEAASAYSCVLVVSLGLGMTRTKGQPSLDPHP